MIWGGRPPLGIYRLRGCFLLGEEAGDTHNNQIFGTISSTSR